MNGNGNELPLFCVRHLVFDTKQKSDYKRRIHAIIELAPSIIFLDYVNIFLFWNDGEEVRGLLLPLTSMTFLDIYTCRHLIFFEFEYRILVVVFFLISFDET